MMATLSTNDLLSGIDLVLALAVSSHLVAKLIRLPAIVVLLPVGFVAGILTEEVQPTALPAGTVAAADATVAGDPLTHPNQRSRQT